jgi:hypothetical protein
MNSWKEWWSNWWANRRGHRAYDLPALAGVSLRTEEALSRYNPPLLEQFQFVVEPSAQQALMQRQRLEEMQAEYQPQITAYAAEKAGLENVLTTFELAPQSQAPRALRRQKVAEDKRLELLINGGLSLMLGLGISHYLGIEVTKLHGTQYLLLLLAFMAAIGITVGSKRAIVYWVVRMRSDEQAMSFPHQVAFWERLQAGDIVCYMSILIPMGETVFAGPGLLELLSPELAENLLTCMSTYMVAGLVAMLNVFLAWGIAWEQIRCERERMATEQAWLGRQQSHELALRERDRDDVYKGYCQQLAMVTEKLNQLYELLEAQGIMAQEQFYRARQEYEQWKRLYDRWCKRHKRLLAGM